jgi:pimeloyl-ACP methyl ester carboxylesterase
MKCVNGINTHYFDKGRGEAVLFLHGWGSSYALFKPFMDAVAGQYRVCALDLPGFGETGEPPAAWSVDDYGDFVLAFLDSLGIGRVIPVAHSFGGRIVIKLASREKLPVTINKIVLIDSAGIRPKKTVKQKLRLALYKGVKHIIALGPIKKKVPALTEAWRKKFGSPDYLNAGPRMRECFIKVINEDLTPCLPKINCPVLLVWGENDRETPIEDGKLMERLIPGAGLVTLNNAGHYSFLDQGYTFGRVLDSFLNIKR